MEWMWHVWWTDIRLMKKIVSEKMEGTILWGRLSRNGFAVNEMNPRWNHAVYRLEYIKEQKKNERTHFQQLKAYMVWKAQKNKYHTNRERFASVEQRIPIINYLIYLYIHQKRHLINVPDNNVFIIVKLNLVKQMFKLNFITYLNTKAQTLKIIIFTP